MSKLVSSEKIDWKNEDLTAINRAYRSPLQDNRIQIVNKKLVLLKPILANHRHVMLIIVPSPLRRQLFSHYHAGPTGGHMGEYKTLYRLRLRFFWPKLREDVKEWVKTCGHCVAYNIWRNRRQELHFSWPVTIPFYIMHLDIWSPGHVMLHHKDGGHVLNCMCDLTQFIVSCLLTDTKADALSRIFMEQVVLNFGMVAIVVVDADSRFRSTFEAMCKTLKLTFWPLSRGNHKGNSVERYHRFLNKTQTICGQDRGTHEVFHQNVKTSQYAWNSAPIDDTYIPRCVAAVGREFRFPLDI